MFSVFSEHTLSPHTKPFQGHGPHLISGMDIQGHHGTDSDTVQLGHLSSLCSRLGTLGSKKGERNASKKTDGQRERMIEYDRDKTNRRQVHEVSSNSQHDNQCEYAKMHYVTWFASVCQGVSESRSSHKHHDVFQLLEELPRNAEQVSQSSTPASHSSHPFVSARG